MLRFENSEIASTREVLLSVRHWFCFEFRVHNISLPIMIQFLKAVRNDLGQYANYCAQSNDIPFSSATSRLHQIKMAESRVTSGFKCYYFWIWMDSVVCWYIADQWPGFRLKPSELNQRRFLPTAREGNVFRSVCLFTGGLPPKGDPSPTGRRRFCLRSRPAYEGGSTSESEGLPPRGWRGLPPRGSAHSPVVTSSGDHYGGQCASYRNASLCSICICGQIFVGSFYWLNFLKS